MKSKSKILYFTILALSIIICFWNFSKKDDKSIASNVQTTNSKVEIESISKKQDVSILKINYHLSKEDPILHIYSPQFNNIDTKELEKEFNDKDIGRDDEARQIHLNLKNDIDDKGNGSFNLRIRNNSQTLLTITDINDEELLNKTINDIKKDSPIQSESTPFETDKQEQISSETEGSSEKSNDQHLQSDVPPAPRYLQKETNLPGWDDNWTRKDKLMVTPGKPIKNEKDGSITYPVIYFGALNYALEGITPRDSTGGRPLGITNGQGRKNNITAANTGIIYVPKNSTLNEIQKKKGNKNQWYTNTIGDALYPDQDRYKGSQRNFITTNIFDYTHSSGDIERPRIYGPDYENGKEWGINEDNVHFYSRLSKSSGANLVEQRLVFYQRNNNIWIRVTVTQRFNKDNAVIVTTEFKNVSSIFLDNFSGYTFRDITFIKGTKFFGGSWQANKLRSLGNNNGLYASRAALGGRIEFNLNNLEDSPYAWAARGTRSSFYKGKDNGKDVKESFPWNNRGPASGTYDSFPNILSVGDKDIEPGAGNTWLDETKDFDSGIAMHTKNQSLAPEQQVKMSYMVNMKIKNSKPNLDVHNEGYTRNTPYIVQPNDDYYKLNGAWHHFDDDKVNIKYLVKEIGTEDDFEKDPTEELIKTTNSATNGFVAQSKEDKKIGKLQSFEKKLPLDDIGPGLYKISVLAMDTKGQISQVENRYVTVPSRAPNSPTFLVSNPSKDAFVKFHPYILTVDKSKSQNTFDLSGDYGANLKKNEQVEITYSSSLGTEGKATIIDEHHWELKKFNLQKIINSDETEYIKFRIIIRNTKTNEQSDPYEEFFYFKIDQTDSFGIDAPNKIDFGKHNLAPNSEVNIKPILSGKMYLYDYRNQNSNPLKINLTVTNFAKIKQNMFSVSSDNEILNTDLFWKNKKINESSQYVFDKIDNNNQFDLTDELRNNLKLKIKSDEEVEQGTFKSHWLWEARDTI